IQPPSTTPTEVPSSLPSRTHDTSPNSKLNTNKPLPPTSNTPERRKTLTQKLSDGVFGSKIENKSHEKYAFMYHMLTGIRLSVSRNETREEHELLPSDFKAKHKLTSDATGAELESKQRYDFKFKDYCPLPFRKIRTAFGVVAPDYLSSLTGKYILSELYSPGKSKSYLYYSHDYRYIIKTIHKAEQKRLLSILPQYVEYVTTHPNTLLARYYGLHRMHTPKRTPIYFVVMSNVFPPNYDMHWIFDLKGSTIGRYTDTSLKRKRVVLKDMNWVQLSKKLRLGPEKTNLFIQQIESDMLFLMGKNIMDYSLLIGIHELDRLRKRSKPTSTNLGTSEPSSASKLSSSANNTPSSTLSMSHTMGSNFNESTRFDPSLSEEDEQEEMNVGSGVVLNLVESSQVFESSSSPFQRTTSATKADLVRRALQQPEITRLDTITALQLPPKAPTSYFFADNGGFRATDKENRPLNELYFMSIIDILTPYDATKKLEHFFKSFVSNRKEISAVRPMVYGQRFVKFIKKKVVSSD
ncbi:Phosphatidylinositol-4-phosphate 5-kinase, partial [Coelomomyces lativittatus]